MHFRMKVKLYLIVMLIFPLLKKKIHLEHFFYIVNILLIQCTFQQIKVNKAFMSCNWRIAMDFNRTRLVLVARLNQIKFLRKE